MKIPKHKNWRDRDYLNYIKDHPCTCEQFHKDKCKGGVDPHHIRTGTDGGTGLKPSNGFAIPLCRHHHEIMQRNPKKLFKIMASPFKECVYLLMGWMRRKENGQEK